MPRGFFTIEAWKPPARGKKGHWVAVAHLDGCHTLTDAMQTLDQRGQTGFYRIVQTQRMVWVEKINGRLRLRKWHAMSPESLARNAEAFQRDGKR